MASGVTAVRSPAHDWSRPHFLQVGIVRNVCRSRRRFVPQNSHRYLLNGVLLMTIASVWAELWEVIAADPGSDSSPPVDALVGDDTQRPKVRIVYRGEPVKGYEQTGTWVAITPGGYSSDYVNIWLRVCRQVGERPIEDQQAVIEVVELVEDLLDTQNRFERGDWVIGPRPNIADWVAEISLRGPRE